MSQGRSCKTWYEVAHGPLGALVMSLSSFLAKVNKDRFLQEHTEPQSFQTAECLRFSVLGLKVILGFYLIFIHASGIFNE